jgi:twitching motility protein PilT
VTQTPSPPAGESAPTVHAVPIRQAVVLPMARQARNASVAPLPDLTTGGLVHLLRTVAARGGSALYIASDAQPLMRIDGEMQPMEEVDPLSAVEIETLLLGVMPQRTHEAPRTGEETEWISEVPGLGRVRCVSFCDHRGAGGIFRIMTARVVTAEQLGLAREVQSLALQPEGLVLIAGPRSSGKSTLISAFVDLINRKRRDHVITIENEIQVVHESRGSMISQREVRGEGPGLLAAISVALREDPDVLAIEELSGDGVMPLVLEAARSGRLVIAGLRANSTADAVDRVFDRFGQDQRRHAQLSLAESLRGIIVQTLLRKPGGGRAAAREVLLNTPAVASLIADGRTSQLAVAIDAGRKVGMMSLNESMVALVKSGAVDASEAYRRAGDRQALVVLLKRHGVDTSLIERLA